MMKQCLIDCVVYMYGRTGRQRSVTVRTRAKATNPRTPPPIPGTEALSRSTAKGAGVHVVLTEFVVVCSCATLDADYASLRRVVGLLLGRDLVFGDLREPNVLTTSGGRAFLVDIGWCSTVGGAQYPSGRRLLDRGYARVQGCATRVPGREGARRAFP